MKKIILSFLIFKFTAIAAAGSFPNMIISTVDAGWIQSPTIILPTAGQSFRVWVQMSYFDCSYQSNVHIDTMANNINIFVELGNNDVCAGPLPPIYVSIAEIGGLAAGSYNLTSYFVPEGDVFPPNSADYSDYFRDNIQFEVFGAAVIDSTTNVGLAILILLMLVVGFNFRK